MNLSKLDRIRRIMKGMNEADREMLSNNTPNVTQMFRDVEQALRKIGLQHFSKEAVEAAIDDCDNQVLISTICHALITSAAHYNYAIEIDDHNIEGTPNEL